MKVSRQFLQDFAYLANHYGWLPAEVEDIKAETRANPELVRYWSILAAAHRAGYVQTPENNFIRLRDWCLARGVGDPFARAFDPAVLVSSSEVSIPVSTETAVAKREVSTQVSTETETWSRGAE